MKRYVVMGQYIEHFQFFDDGFTFKLHINVLNVVC